MPSTITWLDYSEYERRKMLDVLDKFREHETRDELGVGSIRDAFANLLFPGTSTIQTRARYFLFVPWIYLELETRRVPSHKITRRARDQEVALIHALSLSEETSGVIGQRAKEKLQRLPSNVYWQGLGEWGIRLFPGSQAEYHRYLNAFYSLQQNSQHTDDGEPVAGRERVNWDPNLPDAPDGLLELTSFALTRTEARYLREQVMTRLPRSLLAFLVDRGRSTEAVEFPWQHPQLADFPAYIQAILVHGRNFSEAINGAALLYNLMLAEKSGNKDRVDEYRGVLDEWSEALRERSDAFRQWPPDFWQVAEAGRTTISLPTRDFVRHWLAMALQPAVAERIAEHAQARDLIAERERRLKGGLARLENPRALELWNGAAGTAPLNYRWNISQVIVADIQDGLKT